jgi:hypothetical protein
MRASRSVHARDAWSIAMPVSQPRTGSPAPAITSTSSVTSSHQPTEASASSPGSSSS